MCDVNGKHEVPPNYPEQDIQIRSLGRINKPLCDLDNQQDEGTISVVVCHDGVDEDDKEDESMLVECVVPWNNLAKTFSEAFTVGRQVLFCGTLGGWSQRLDMMSVKVTSGYLHNGQVRK